MPGIVAIDPPFLTRPPKTTRSRHDSLHDSKWCWCKCPFCWFEWVTTNPKTGEKRKVGICICEDCQCPSKGREYIHSFVRFGKVEQ